MQGCACSRRRRVCVGVRVRVSRQKHLYCRFCRLRSHDCSEQAHGGVIVADGRVAPHGGTRIQRTVGARVEDANQLNGLVRSQTAHSGRVITAQ